MSLTLSSQGEEAREQQQQQGQQQQGQQQQGQQQQGQQQQGQQQQGQGQQEEQGLLEWQDQQVWGEGGVFKSAQDQLSLLGPMLSKGRVGRLWPACSPGQVVVEVLGGEGQFYPSLLSYDPEPLSWSQASEAGMPYAAMAGCLLSEVVDWGSSWVLKGMGQLALSKEVGLGVEEVGEVAKQAFLVCCWGHMPLMRGDALVGLELWEEGKEPISSSPTNWVQLVEEGDSSSPPHFEFHIASTKRSSMKQGWEGYSFSVPTTSLGGMVLLVYVKVARPLLQPTTRHLLLGQGGKPLEPKRLGAVFREQLLACIESAPGWSSHKQQVAKLLLPKSPKLIRHMYAKLVVEEAEGQGQEGQQLLEARALAMDTSSSMLVQVYQLGYSSLIQKPKELEASITAWRQEGFA